MKTITSELEIEAGMLFRRQVRREIKAYGLASGLNIEIEEDKGFFNSIFFIKATGNESEVKLFTNAIQNWIKAMENI
jgi:hypothetical protein